MTPLQKLIDKCRKVSAEATDRHEIDEFFDTGNARRIHELTMNPQTTLALLKIIEELSGALEAEIKRCGVHREFEQALTRADELAKEINAR